MILQLLDVLIGLTLVYLIFSTAASIGVELLEARFRQRGKLLERGIGEILGQTLHAAGQGREAAAGDLVRQLYESPWVFSLYEGRYESGSNRLPSEIPATRFAGAVLALAAQEGSEFRGVVDSMLKVSGLKIGDDPEKVRKAIADYFDESMQRVSNWYRRHVRLVLLAIGAVFAVALNADSLSIIRVLSQDDALRARIVATAIGVQDEAPTSAPTCAEATTDCQQRLRRQLALVQSLGLPLGWNEIGLPPCLPAAGDTACGPGRAFLSDALFVLAKIFGLALTALATTLGAPFWFELLQRLIRARDVVGKAKAAVAVRKAAAEAVEDAAELESDDSAPDPSPNKPRTVRTPRRRRSTTRPPRTPTPAA